MRRTVKIKKENSVRIANILTIGIALVFTAIATSLPYYYPIATAQQTNQTTIGGAQSSNTTNTNNTGIGNVKAIPKIANLPPGNNTKIIMYNKNIANPNTFKAFGKEHSVNGTTLSSISQLQPKNMTSSVNK
jgi:hypothetical protein